MHQPATDIQRLDQHHDDQRGARPGHGREQQQYTTRGSARAKSVSASSDVRRARPEACYSATSTPIITDSSTASAPDGE